MSTWRAFPIAVVALFYLGYLTGCADSVSGAPRDQSGIRTDLPSRTILIDDRDISMTSPADAPTKREELVQFLWGTRGFPSSKMPVSVEKNVSNPIKSVDISNLTRVDRLVVDMGQNVKNELFHFVPAVGNGGLVIVHQGHISTFDIVGIAETIADLVADGYGVLGALMPCFSSLPCPIEVTNPAVPHDDLINQVVVPDGEGNVLKYFVEHLAIGLNYLRTMGANDQFPSYRRYHMTGLSGGGWTTVMYAAIDPSIVVSVPVSGSKPMYMRPCATCVDGYEGDREQTYPPFYGMAGYLDLYALGAAGPGRRQIQVQIRHDACCFGEDFYNDANSVPGLSWDQSVRAYENKLALFFRSNTDLGWWRFEIDETSAGLHRISPATRAQVLLAELDGDRRPFGASSSAAVYTGEPDGLVVRRPTSRAVLPSTIVGSPALVGPSDVLVRNTESALVHLSDGPSGWRADRLPGIISSEPVAISTADRLEVVAVREDSRLWRWSIDEESMATEATDGSTEVVGTPALVSSGTERLDAFVRRSDGGVQHIFWRGGPGWSTERLGSPDFGSPVFRGFPSAVANDNGSLDVYVRGTTDELWEASQTEDGAPWTFVSVATLAGAPNVRIDGSPSAIAARSQGLFVAIRSSRSKGLVIFERPSASHLATWSVRSVTLPNGSQPSGGSRFVLSPTGVPGGAFVLGARGDVWLASLAGDWSWWGTIH